MTLSDMINSCIALAVHMVTYPVTGFINLVVGNINYTITPVISIINHFISMEQLAANLVMQFITATYDSRFVILLGLMIGIVVTLRLYSVVHGKTFALNILGTGITFTFP